MQRMNRRVLVTGAGGFVGSHLVERLVCGGAQVVAFVRYTSRGDLGALRYVSPEVRRQLEVVHGDLRDPESVVRAATGCQLIMHLGAMISIPYSSVDPREVVETNVLGTLNVLAACRSVGTVERLVHISSSEVYGTARSIPIDEAHPLQAQSPYAASKIGADKLVESFGRTFGVPAVTVRPFNTYGPRQSARAVVPAIISQALTQPVIKLGNVGTTRDLTFVADTVAALVRAADAPAAVVGQTFNIGTGVETSVHDVVEHVFAILGHRKPVVTDEVRVRPPTSEVYRLVADSRRARQLLGWEPSHPLRQGLEHTVEWIREHLDSYDAATYLI